MSQQLVGDRQSPLILVRWGKRRHLEAMCNGILQLNTPEFYCLHSTKAFGDRYESCGYSYRQGRDKLPPQLLINGVEVTGFTALTAVRVRVHGCGVRG